MAEEVNLSPLSPPPTPKTSLTIPLLLILSIFSLAISSYLFWQNQRLMQQLAAIPTPNASPIGSPQPATESADPTVGWKTYTNSTYKYQIKYPPSFLVGENGMGGGDIQKAAAISIYDKAISDDYRSARFSVTRRIDPDTFDNVVNKHFQKLTTNLMTETERQTAAKNLGITISPNQATNTLTKTAFLSYPAYQFSITGSTVDDGASEYIAESHNHKYLWIDTGNGFYLISYTNTDQMAIFLSTFKFTE